MLRCAVLVAVLSLGAHAGLAQGPSPSLRTLALSGSFTIGTRRFEWVDSSRVEVASLIRRDSLGVPRQAPAAGPRRVIVQVWYPSETRGGMVARAPYNRSVAAFAGILRDTVRLRRYQELTGRAFLDEQPRREGGRYPLILFSPGGSMFVEEYTILLEDLASRGFVVAAVGHPGTSLVTFEDGAFGVESAWRPPAALSMSLELDSLRASWAFFRERDRYLAGDLRFVAAALSDRKRSSIADIVDASRVGFAGHSTGGAVAAMTAQSFEGAPRSALVVYDVLLPAFLFDAPARVPMLLVHTPGPNYPPSWTDRLLMSVSSTAAAAYDARISDGTHLGFSDRTWLMAADDSTRERALRQLRLVSDVTARFFRHYLVETGNSSWDFTKAAVGNGIVLTQHRR